VVDAIARIGLLAVTAPLGFILSAQRPESTAALVERVLNMIAVSLSVLPLVTDIDVAPAPATPALTGTIESNASVVTHVTPPITVAAENCVLPLSFKSRVATVAARLTGCVACQNVPDTGTAVARSCVSVSGPETATVAAIETGCVACQNVPLTGTAAARNCVSVRGPETATVAAIETGCVACQNVPETGTVPLMLTVPLTGCVACQNVPVTGVDGIEAIETGTAAARS
jgi:hypothetical protein